MLDDKIILQRRHSIMNDQAFVPKTPEKKNLLKPSPKSPSRSGRKKSAHENKYVEGVKRFLAAKASVLRQHTKAY